MKSTFRSLKWDISAFILNLIIDFLILKWNYPHNFRVFSAISVVLKWVSCNWLWNGFFHSKGKIPITIAYKSYYFCFTIDNLQIIVIPGGCQITIIHLSNYLQGVPKNPFRILGNNVWYFSKLFLHSKISCISSSLKKEISILSHIGNNITYILTSIPYLYIYSYLSPYLISIHLPIYLLTYLYLSSCLTVYISNFLYLSSYLTIYISTYPSI